MTERTEKTVCWIYRGHGETESQRYDTICRTLSKAGYTLLWLNCPVDDNQLTSEWLEENVPITTGAIFLCDKDLTWSASLVRRLKTNTAAHIMMAPLFWLYEGVGELVQSRVSDLGVDDYFSATISPDELLMRLELRWRKAEEFGRLLRELQDQATKIAKSETTLKQREEFLGVCAHDLRSPLGLIQSSLAMILNAEATRPTLSSVNNELLSRARRQATQALSLVNDLLDVMAFEQGMKPRFELLRLHDFLDEFHKDYAFQGQQKQIKVHYHNAVPDWRILADGDRLRQLFQNLLVNALKFTDSGKNITIDVKPFVGRRKIDPPYPMVVISVRDEGIGIPRKEMQRIFDRFAQMKNYGRSDGRGLGLTVAKQISVAHDGNIWVESEEGKGSIFHVLIPHVVRDTAPAFPIAEQTALVIESSEIRRAERFDQLKSWGYQVYYARDGAEALTYLYHLKPGLVLMTPGTGKFTESEFCNHVKGNPLLAPIPLIMVVESIAALGQSLDGILCDATLEFPLTKSSLDSVVKKTKKTTGAKKRAA